MRRLSREIGAGNAVLYSLARILGRLSGGRARLYKYYLVAQPVAAEEITPARRGRNMELRELDHHEIRATDFGRPETAIRHRLDNGCRCLVATRGADMLGFQWFSLRDYPEDEVRCLFELAPEDSCAWDFDIFVKPEARLQPVFPRLWDQCNAILRQSGVDLCLSRINAFNTASRRSHERLGAAVIGWAVFLAVGRLQLAFFSSDPWLHLSLSPANIPRWPASALARRKIPKRIADPPRTCH